MLSQKSPVYVALSIIAVTVNVVFEITIDGVPLTVQVPCDMDRPVGNAGAIEQVAPVTLVMPPPELLPEPLAALELYWKVMSLMMLSTSSSIPSTLG